MSEKKKSQEESPFGKIFVSHVCGDPDSHPNFQQNLQYLDEANVDAHRDFLQGRYCRNTAIYKLRWISNKAHAQNFGWLIE